MAKKMKPPAKGNGANGSGDAGPPQNLTALHERISGGFKTILDLDDQVAAAIEKHVKPLTDERKKAWRTLKKDTNIEREDLELHYKIFKRVQDARDLDEDGAYDRIVDNLRTVFNAMQRGGQLDFLTAMADAEREELSDKGPQDWIAEGKAASQKGIGQDKCPYPAGDDARYHWTQGWLADQTRVAEEMGDDKGKAAAKTTDAPGVVLQ